MNAVLGSIVQKGIFYAGTFKLDSRLNVLLLPMLAMPSNPTLSEVPVRPNLTRLIVPLACVENRASTTVDPVSFIIIN